MGISIAIDGENYDQKTQEKYAEVFEKILGIPQKSDIVSFFYIEELIKVLNSFDELESQIIQHYFGLNGTTEKDIGTIAKLFNFQFVSSSINTFKKIMEDLFEQRYLYEANVMLIYYDRALFYSKKVLKENKELLRKLKSRKNVSTEIIFNVQESIYSMVQEIDSLSQNRNKISKQFETAKKEYKRYQ